MLGAWSGPALVVLFLIGCIPLAGFIPPPSPAASADEIAAMFRDDTTAIRIGCLVMIVGLSLIAPWGATIAAQTRRMERGFPILTYTQIACVGAALIVVIFIPMAWAVAAFRPDDVSPDVTRSWNDFAWFLFLFTWPPFSVWCLAIALAIFRDESVPSIFPRWTAYLNLWTAFLFIPAGLMAFFKTGPFSYRGLFTMYMPLAVFFIWMIAMTVVLLRAIDREHAARPARAGAAA